MRAGERERERKCPEGEKKKEEKEENFLNNRAALSAIKPKGKEKIRIDVKLDLVAFLAIRPAIGQFCISRDGSVLSSDWSVLSFQSRQRGESLDGE